MPTNAAFLSKAINPTLAGCVARFIALQAIYEARNGKADTMESEFDSIMDESISKPFNELLDSISALGPAALDSLKDYVAGATNPYAYLSALLSPIDTIINVVTVGAPREQVDKIKAILESYGITGANQSTVHTVAMVLLAIGKAKASIVAYEHLLKDARVLGKKIARQTYDIVTPTVHPFNSSLYDLEEARKNFVSISSQVSARGFVDTNRYNDAVEHMKAALASLENGVMSLKYIGTKDFDKALTASSSPISPLTSAFLGQVAPAKDKVHKKIPIKTPSGQVKYVDELTYLKQRFLPPVGASLKVEQLKSYQDIFALFNSDIETVFNALDAVTQTVLAATDITVAIKALCQYFAIETAELERMLDAASADPNSKTVDARGGLNKLQNTLLSGSPEFKPGQPSQNAVKITFPNQGNVYGVRSGTLQTQALAYGRLQLDTQLADTLVRRLMNYLIKQEGNDSSALVRIRKYLKRIQQSRCTFHYTEVNSAIQSVINSYYATLSGKGSSSAILQASKRLDNAVEAQLKSLECVTNAYDEAGRVFHMNSDLLAAMAALGGALALMPNGGFIKNLKAMYSSFSADKLILQQMHDELNCMKNACSNPSVNKAIDALAASLTLKQKRVAVGQDAAKQYSKLSNFSSKYKGNKFTKAVQRFVSAIQKLSC